MVSWLVFVSTPLNLKLLAGHLGAAQPKVDYAHGLLLCPIGSNIAVVLHFLTKPQHRSRTEECPNRLNSRFPGTVWPKAFRLSLDLRFFLLLSPKH